MALSEGPGDPPDTDAEDREKKLSDLRDQLQILEHIQYNTHQGLTEGDRQLQGRLEQQVRELVKQQEIFDKPRPVNDNQHPGEPWQRAELILEAHAKMSGSGVHPFDVPQTVIADLLKDLMHYCRARSQGEAIDSPNRIDFDEITRAAKGDFLKEQKPIEQRPQAPEEQDYFKQYLNGNKSAEDSKFEPELQHLLAKLYDRQQREALDLLQEQRDGLHQLNDYRQVSDPGLREELLAHFDEDVIAKEDHQAYTSLIERFAEERERYITDHLKAREIAAEMASQERSETLDQGLDDDQPKLTH